MTGHQKYIQFSGKMVQASAMARVKAMALVRSQAMARISSSAVAIVKD